MTWNDRSYKEKKVISIGTVSELTGLSERQIRYYEQRKLIFPDRSKTGIRKYSFSDIELLIEIANKIEDGVLTNEIRKEMKKKEAPITNEEIRNSLLKGQINVQFKL
ncbi:MerR family transcriptional regulator [Peribacillus tepidiphilus]|jgi:MerR family transcriptional regulator, global nitrogen regulator|uniref:MerR family transcriptional regulator n=1 Tax=Peribacillus tepidiphilus TaxID=2652445 RepID=UPI001291E48D|nr:MerR family transcriptional regulator [Peribacillus tepidiphilus]